MFVCSVKGNTLKLCTLILTAIIAVTVMVIALPKNDAVAAGSIFEGNDKISYDKIKTEKARIEFLKSFGWEISKGCIEEVEVNSLSGKKIVPQKKFFDDKFYNEIMLKIRGLETGL